MRRQGQYIIDKRLKFKKGLQKEFIRKIKEKSGLTWKTLANKFNLSEHTLIVDWQEEKTTIPYQIAEALIKEYPFEKKDKIFSDWVEEILPEKWGQINSGNINKKKIKIPQKSEELSEIFGAILGDGHLERKTLTLTGHINEKEHHLYIAKIIKKIFGLDSKTFRPKGQNATVLKIYSTELINFFKVNGFVLGNKIKNKESLPKWVFEKKEFVYGALRGLLDTDGGIYQKQKKYKRAIIEFQTKSPYIREDIFKLLKKIGFNPSKSSGNVRIQNQKEIKKFISKIGCANPKNIVRYKYFTKTGEIPLKEKLNKEIILLKVNKPFKAPLV